MGILSLINHFGTFLLLVATILLIVASVSAPTVSNISLLTVNLGSASGEITFGTFGYCVRGVTNWGCSSTSIGYDPAEVVERLDGTDFSGPRSRSAEALTHVMILHPIGAGVAFIAFALSLGSSFFGSFMSSLVAGSAFLVTTIALICDFVWISFIRRNVNDDDDGGSVESSAHYDAALWCVLVAAICSLFASVILFFTCCSGRANRSRAERRKVDYHSPPATTTRRRWWSRNRY